MWYPNGMCGCSSCMMGMPHWQQQNQMAFAQPICELGNIASSCEHCLASQETSRRRSSRSRLNKNAGKCSLESTTDYSEDGSWKAPTNSRQFNSLYPSNGFNAQINAAWDVFDPQNGNTTTNREVTERAKSPWMNDDEDHDENILDRQRSKSPWNNIRPKSPWANKQSKVLPRRTPPERPKSPWTNQPPTRSKSPFSVNRVERPKSPWDSDNEVILRPTSSWEANRSSNRPNSWATFESSPQFQRAWQHFISSSRTSLICEEETITPVNRPKSPFETIPMRPKSPAVQTSLAIMKSKSAGNLSGSWKNLQDECNDEKHNSDDYKSTDDGNESPPAVLPAVIRRRNRNRRKKAEKSSMVEPTGLMRWDDQNAGQQQQQQPQQQPQQRAFAPNGRSQSISDDQWAQVMGTGPQRSQTVMNASMMQHQQRGGVPPLGGRSGAVTPGGGRSGLTGRGIVSSASVCDLNQMSQPQPPPQVPQHSFGAPMQNAGSFQQLNMMGYPQGNMMWAPPACDMCNVPAMYPPMAGPSMKRAASNLSMNMSSTSSEMGSCGWHHHHHHMPMYPGYHPGFQPQMVPPIGMHGSQMGLNVSIPDSMHAFSKVPSSSASSIRSSSHRIPKSSKTKSFSSADNDGRNRRHRRRSESEDSAASYSDSEEIEGMSDERLAWQCDHCTFINQPDTKTCGMCSKTGGDIDNGIGSNNRRRSGSDRRRGSRRNRNTDDGDGRDDDISVVRSNLSFHLRDEKKYSSSNLKSSSRNLPKQLSNRRLNKHKWSSDDQGRSSISASDEDTMLARQMKGLDVSKSRGSGTGHYEGVTTTARDKERLRRKKEGNFRRKY